MSNDNIILIGMPGAGKSSVGVILAKRLGKSFFDTDLLIQEATVRLLQEIIDEVGVAHFLQVEEAVVLEFNKRHCVVATGGSVVYSEKAMNHLREHGTIIYLQLPYSEVAVRIENMSSRGIAMGKDQQLIDLYQERVPLYEKYADIVVDCSNSTVEEVVTKVSEHFNVQK